MLNRLLPFFFVLATLVCGALAIWQLNRYHEKTTEIARIASVGPLPPLTNTEFLADPTGPWANRRLCFRGYYDPRYTFLWDNHVQHGQIGYEVLNLLNTEGVRGALFAHRGWVPRSPNGRNEHPHIAIDDDVRTWCGTLIRPTVLPFLRNSLEYPLHEGNNVILDTRTKPIEAGVGVPIFPWVLYLDAGQPGLFEAVTLPVDRFPPARHLGYALQWALLALVSVVMGKRTAKKVGTHIKKHSRSR
ncbi:MAG: SURF1 family protein [Pseudomonadota bacterium]